MMNIQEVASSEFGLVLTSSLDPRIERFQVMFKRFQRLPFFYALDSFMLKFFEQHYLVNPPVSYAIWGGVAANLILELIGRTRIHYSLHDVELFLVRHGNIYHPQHVIDDLSQNLSSNCHFLLGIGGQEIIRVREGLSVEEFQAKRIHLDDGDICLNNVLLFVDRANGCVLVEAPIDTIMALIVGVDTLEVKDASEIKYIDRLARRIYRNISKAIRFEQVAGLTFSVSAEKTLDGLIDSYSNKLYEYFLRATMSPEEEVITKEWIVNANITGVQSGMEWIYRMTISETAKRLAGVQGISCFDQNEFCRFVMGETPDCATLFNHSLIEKLRKCAHQLPGTTKMGTRLDIARRCYMSFSKYQRPGAERLCPAYSLPN